MTYLTFAFSILFTVIASAAFAAGEATGTVPIDSLSPDQLDALASVLGGLNR